MPLYPRSLRRNRGILFLLASAIGQAWGVDVDSAALLRRVQAKAIASAKTLPRYYCRQSLERQVFAPNANPPQGCGRLPELGLADLSDSAAPASRQKAGYSRVSSDSAHLDVMIAEGTELFSWPGGGHFATNDPGDLLGGGFTGNGDFGSYVATVFGQTQVTFHYLGACPSGLCVRYSFDVPVAVSGYWLKTPVSQVTVGYHGTFEVDPQSGDLLGMKIIPTDLAQNMRNACDLRTEMKYARTTLNSSAFTIPQAVVKEYLAANGWYFANWTQYTGCRQYAAESALTFGDVQDSKPGGDANKAGAQLPRAGAKLELRLTSKVDSDANAAGDTVEAALVRAIPDTAGGMIPKGTLVRGHLAQVERTYYPRRSVTVAMRFDAIVLNGEPLPVALIPAAKQDLRGRGVFQFGQSRIVLDGAFTSEWRVQP